MTDQQARYEDLVSELRTQIEALRATAAARAEPTEPAKPAKRMGRAAPTGQQAGRQNR
jgi:hypothetical protein